MNSLTQALSAALLHLLWQGLLVVLILWIALVLLRKRSANARYLASGAALGMLAVMPAITAWAIYSAPSPSAGIELSAAAPATGVPRPSGMAWWPVLQAWILPVWSAGVLLFSIRLVWGCRQVSSLRRHGKQPGEALLENVARLAERLGVTGEVQTLLTTDAETPSVIGWIRPVLLVPAAALGGLTAPQLEAVLAHELAHVRRYDYLANLLQMTVETLLFYHPAVWWISERIHQERELCCDDLAVGACGDPIGYARALTTLERLRMTAPSPALGSTGGPLAYRIRRLVGETAADYAPAKLPGVLVLCLALACLTLNLNWSRGQAQTSATAPHLSGERFVGVDLGGSAVLHRTPVEYPREALEKRIQGVVRVEATLDGSGSVSDARVLEGPAELRKAALESVLEWHFSQNVGGTATRQVSIAFELPKDTGMPSQIRPDREATLRFLREQLHTLQEHPEASPSYAGNTLALNAKILAVQQTVDSPAMLAGRTLKSTHLQDLPEPLANRLVGSLPVHAGDVLSRENIDATLALVRQADPHLECTFAPVGEKQAELLIRLPYGPSGRR